MSRTLCEVNCSQPPGRRCSRTVCDSKDHRREAHAQANDISRFPEVVELARLPPKSFMSSRKASPYVEERISAGALSLEVACAQQRPRLSARPFETSVPRDTEHHLGKLHSRCQRVAMQVDEGLSVFGEPKNVCLAIESRRFTQQLASSVSARQVRDKCSSTHCGRLASAAREELGR